MPSRHRLSYVVAEDPASYRTPKVEPAHFWTSTRKDIADLRKQFFRQWFLASLELWLLIFTISAIYLGVGSNPSRYTKNIDVNIVDFDGGLAGNYFNNAFRQTPPGNATLRWLYKNFTDFNWNIDEAQQEVENGKVWATIILRANTTSTINATLAAYANSTESLRSPLVGAPPVLVIYEDGRNSFSMNNYILPPIRTAVAAASARYGQAIRSTLISELSASGNTVNRTIQLSNTVQLGPLLVNPLDAKYTNLHPASPFVGTYRVFDTP